jgi:hypothetical protein
LNTGGGRRPGAARPIPKEAAMRTLIATAGFLAAALPTPVLALTLKPIAEARLRYEAVDQDGLAINADALTLRGRVGLQATQGAWSALIESQGTVALDGHYYDGLKGSAARPLISDPENVALYLAQLQYRTKGFALTAGRQRISLDDERFVGNVGFRQNAQTFDAVRAEWTVLPKLKADVSYVWSVRTIWGVDGNGARQQAVRGDTILANLAYASPIGTVTGFTYLVDQDEAAVQGFRLSSQTYGLRIVGGRALSKKAKLLWTGSYARQSDYHRNPNDYRADYYSGEAAVDISGFRLGAGYEVLGADKGAALTSFQTPLGTNFKFQGWADKFLTTPPDGVRDLYGSATYAAKSFGPLKAVSVQAAWHRFESDRLVRHYGNEVDLLAGGKLGPVAVSARYARYDADLLATDTSKFWLQLDWTL